MRSEFALDEFGRERKGRVFDGQNNLLFISEFVYEGDELIEEREFLIPKVRWLEDLCIR